MKNERTFEENQERFGMQLFCIILAIVFGIWLIDTIQAELRFKAFETRYCFQENVDGSLYHYECEK